MNERLIARLLLGLGLCTLGLAGVFGAGWSEAGAVERSVFIAASVATAVGLGLDVKRRHQDKKRQSVAGDPGR